MKTAILQVADTGPLESLVIMLRSVGYACYLPNDQLRGQLRDLHCDTVLDIRGLVENWGYEHPLRLPEAGPDFMHTTDLYVDIKAHRNGPKVWKQWPHLREKTLWYRINGGEPEHVIKDGEDYGDERNLLCPILTPNRWYALPGPWQDKAYSCWPPFYRQDEYYPRLGRPTQTYSDPVCLIHNVTGWGYGDLIEAVRGLGVRCLGAGSPDGLVKHQMVPALLGKALGMVHLKGSDAPGYALYEALAAACPVVCSRSLIWRNRMEELFVPGITCLVFDHASHDPCNVPACKEEIEAALKQLEDPAENSRIGLAGRQRLLALLWSEHKDAPGLQAWLQRMYR